MYALSNSSSPGIASTLFKTISFRTLSFSRTTYRYSLFAPAEIPNATTITAIAAAATETFTIDFNRRGLRTSSCSLTMFSLDDSFSLSGLVPTSASSFAINLSKPSSGSGGMSLSFTSVCARIKSFNS